MAHNIEKLRELLERCEAASGPDRELDGDVWVFLDDRPFNRVDGPPCYSASLDASIALVERMLPGATYSIDNITGAEARVYVDGVESEFEAEAMTLHLALLSALLAALISQAEGAGA